MADIVLAEHQGRAWLVSGEPFIDDLLASTLPRDISIEFVACVSHADVIGLWVQNCGDHTASGQPWLINPLIIDRIRRSAPGHSVFFGQWAAMLDQDAHSVIRAAADRARQYPDTDVTLACYIDPDGPQMISDLANLRRSVIEAELTALGIAGSRMIRASMDMTEVSGVGPETGRIDIIIKPE
jgi:hypothetical protein